MYWLHTARDTFAFDVHLALVTCSAVLGVGTDTIVLPTVAIANVGLRMKGRDHNKNNKPTNEVLSLHSLIF